MSEWVFGALLFAGFWDKRLGILGAAGSTVTFAVTVSIIPFMPDDWDPVAGFPALCPARFRFLLKDVVVARGVAISLLKQDFVRMPRQ